MSTFLTPRALCTLLLLATTTILSAQNETLEQRIRSAARASYDHYEIPASLPGRGVALIRCDYNDSRLIFPAGFDSIRSAQVESITLLYSIPGFAGFDQQALNRERFRNLLQCWPQAFSDSLTALNIVEQTKVEHATLTHGFVVTYRLRPTKESMKKEVVALREMIEKGGLPSPGIKVMAADTASKSEEASDPVAINSEHSLPKKVSSDAIISSRDVYTWTTCDSIRRPGTRLVGGMLVDTSGKCIGVWSAPFRKDTTYCYYDKAMTIGVMPSLAATPAGVFSPITYNYTDDVVSKTFERHPEWKDMLIACDITGSMSPYTAQLLAWYKLNALDGKVKNFVFFNDGDWKLDNQKVAGSTGGIYHTRAAGYDSVMNTASTAMMKGGGGDCPENDVEALLEGVQRYPDSKEVILIADNWATPRDLSFATQLDRPVRIILCGAVWGINTAYLDLARQTKGSVHLMEEDLTNLAKLNEGERVTIGKRTFTLKDGKFVAVTTL